MNRRYKWPPYTENKNRSYKLDFNSIKKIQGLVETLQIMSFQNDW